MKSAVLLAGLFAMMSGMIAEETIGPVFPVAEIAVLAGVICWVLNLVRRA